MSLTGTTNEQKIWNYLKAQGFNDYGAAGLMGNLYAESGLSPINVQNTYEKKLGYNDETYTAAVDNGSYDNFVRDKAGYGLAQWTYWSRKQGLLNAAKAAGKSVGDLETQLAYLIKELTSYGLLAELKAATSVKSASNTVLLKFEKPASMNSAETQSKRAGYGQNYFNKYAKATAPTPVQNKVCADAVVAVAISQIGYKEKASNSQLDNPTANAGSANWTKFARDFDEKYPKWYNGKKNGYAWCDMFVDWCFLTAFGYETALRLLCQPEKSAGAGCTYSLGYYRNKGQFFTSNPERGDQIFFGTSLSSSGHTGIVEKVEGGYVHTIEGNTSDMVARRRYSLNDKTILGYGRPAYDGKAKPDTPATQGGKAAMSNSPLATYTKITKNKNSPRNHVIDTITIHCIVGQWTAKQGCDYFASTDRQCSANYVVGKDGSIGLSVDEKDRSWCSSNATNDHRAITIEVASDTTHPYAVTDAAYNALIELCADICRRNGIKKLVWSTDKNDRVKHLNGCNMTVHRDFANKACPGDYLYSRHGDIAAKVNAKLGAASAPAPATEPTAPAAFKPYLVRITCKDLNIRSGPGTNYASKGYINPNVYTIVAESDGEGATKWGKLKSGAGWVSLDFCQKV